MDLNCFERVGLFFSCKGLPKMDVTSNTDPFIVVYEEDPNTKKKMLLGNTSVVMDSQNPEWPDQLIINYKFEAVQNLTIQVYDRDSSAPLTNFDKHEFIGEIQFKLSSLMCARGQSYQANFTNGKPGSVIVRAEAISNTRDIFCVQFSAKDLLNKDGMGILDKSDPFLIIKRLREDGTAQVVWKNEPIMNNLCPVWPTTRVPIMNLCNGDINRPIIIEIYDYDSDGNHDYMGAVHTSVKGLMDSGGKPFDVIEEKKKGTMIGTVFKKAYVNSGTFFATNCGIEVHPTFADYILGGCEVSLVIAVDYTGSNGDPRQSFSLHYQSAIQKNQYEQALESVCQVVEPYDTDKSFPLYGFGAYIHGDLSKNGKRSTSVEHCFPLGEHGAVEVQGVAGILAAYKNSIQNVELSGPTLFTPIIEAAIQRASASNCTQENQKYTILLILTDGVINDMDSSISAIVTASNLPMSIIIIGVGNADFGDMSALDSDKGMLKSGSKVASRDIVQFVPFNQFQLKGSVMLAEEVLREVPNQVLMYMKQKKIQPKKAKV